MRVFYLTFPCKTVFFYATDLRPYPLNIFAKSADTRNFSFPKHTHKNTQKPTNIKCRMNCSIHTFLVQAMTRKNLYLKIMSSLNVLLALQFTLNGRELPGWNPLNENFVKSIIRKCTAAAIKSQNDINTCNETMIRGCDMCRQKESVQIQEMLADYSEEELQRFLQEETQE